LCRGSLGLQDCRSVMKRPWMKSLGRLGAAAAVYIGGRKRRRTSGPTRTVSGRRRRIGSRYRRRTRTRYGQRKRQRSRYVFGNPTNYIKQSHSSGRRIKKNTRGAWKVLSGNIESVTQGVRLYTPFGGVAGSLRIQNTTNSALNTPNSGPAGCLYPPIHLWELTSSQNVQNVAGVATLNAPTIGWFPIFSSATSAATLSYSNQFQMSTDDSPGVQSSISNWPANNDILDWCQIKTMFYAPTSRPSRIQIDVVQFKDTRLVPDNTTGVSQFACAFYQAMSKRFTLSPLETGSEHYQKYLKVLDSKTFIMEPKETTEAPNTNFREVNLFYRWNRRCNYKWADDDLMGMTTNNEGQVNQGDVQLQVHPRARIFLMIRGQALNDTVQTTTGMPSYDIVIRTKHSHLST
jgi:hypothetical protein